MIAVVLAGGKGLRLWPESRQMRPKQLCRFVDGKTMLDHTIDRLMTAGSKQVIIITNDSLLPGINEVIEQRVDKELIEIISEPEGRNTAPAVGLVLTRYYGGGEDEILGFFPADHHVSDTEAFISSIRRACLAAKNGRLATIGISPNRPETAYGYIEKTKWEIGEIPGVFSVNSFCEKPDAKTAGSYLASGSHMWNAGIYIGQVKTLCDEYKTHLPEIYEMLIQGFDKYIDSYPRLPEISLDYGIAEKSTAMAVVPADFGWCDLGNWNALAELHLPDTKNNVCHGNDVLIIESKGCIVKQKEKTVVLFGADNLLVVESEDLLLVADRNRAQDIREIVDYLQNKERFDLL